MIFNFGQSHTETQADASPQDYAIFQQIGSAFQQMVMHLDQSISVAAQSNFMDKVKLKGMIIGIDNQSPHAQDKQGTSEAERLLLASQEMVKIIKSFQTGLEQNVNHVTCRMHDFRCYLLTDADPQSIDRQAIYLRARDCVNQTLADLIVLKEHTKEKISKLTLNESDASRMFTLFDAIDQAFNALAIDIQAKIRLLNATLCH